jgi:hypothetical protein
MFICTNITYTRFSLKMQPIVFISEILCYFRLPINM